MAMALGPIKTPPTRWVPRGDTRSPIYLKVADHGAHKLLPVFHFRAVATVVDTVATYRCQAVLYANFGLVADRQSRCATQPR